jgi:hypothetical protein
VEYAELAELVGMPSRLTLETFLNRSRTEVDRRRLAAHPRAVSARAIAAPSNRSASCAVRTTRASTGVNASSVQAYAGHRPVQPVPVQGQCGVDPGEDDQSQPGAGMAKQEVDSVEDPTAAEHLGVVQDEHDRPRPLMRGRREPDVEGVIDRLVEGGHAHPEIATPTRANAARK